MEQLVRFYDPSTKGSMEHARVRASEAKLASIRKQLRGTEVDKVAQDFESLFLSQMLQHVFADVKTDEVFGGGHAEDVYRSLLVDEYGKMITKTGGIGIADHVKRELMKLQEVH